MRHLSVYFLAAGWCAAASISGGYRLTERIPLGSPLAWNSFALDENAHRLYVAHGAGLEVLNADTGGVLGRIGAYRDVRGIALAPRISRGYVTSGSAGKVMIFDLRTLETRGDVTTGRQPGPIVFDTISGHLFAFNEGSSNATVIKDGDLITSIGLGGRPKAAAADGRGRVFVNLEDQAAVVSLDTRGLAVDRRFPLAGCQQPSSMAMDSRHDRLFIGCGNRTMTVLNTATGQVITTLPIGGRVEGSAFDSETGLLFSSGGDGTLTVIRQHSPDSYSVVDTIRTHDGSRTMALDARTHRLFVPFAEAEGTGSFGILVLGR